MYLISETTKEQREQIVRDGVALASLDAPAPLSDVAKEYMQKYIDGEMELSEVQTAIINHYKTV